ncbi:hypothetical protein BOX15_Mlig020287g1 [Macrostomum lignano]|uniref:Rab3 GTPase-activating protein catalytic subunit n=1 Tax=Macrostomum lignano TaxID=282301 RepID=A0A267DGW3_9PLAT|nr:hypothetical protein BOX15_Mlig020287g1 [Macrostomum lignano]
MATFPQSPPLTTETSIIEEEGDVFEITDFTSASDWEQFMSELEEVFNEWKVDGGGRFSVKSGGTGLESVPEAERMADSRHATAAAGSNATRRFGTDRHLHRQQHTWKDQSCSVRYMDCEFRLTHHCQVQPPKPSEEDQPDLAGTDEAGKAAEQPPASDSKTFWPPVLHQIASSDNDFPSVAHCLTRWFGLRELIVVKPSQDQTVCNESRLRLLLSSLCITAHNAGCHLPIFLQVGRPDRRLYFGQALGSGLRTRFEIAQLCKIPRHYRHLQGAIDMFRQRMACPAVQSGSQFSSSNGPSISAAIRLSYSLSQFSDRLLACLSPLPDTLRHRRNQQQRELDLPARLPIGPCEEPISELQLAAVWPRLAEEMVVDTESYTDLDPLHAPVWTLRARFLDDALCRLTDCLGRLLRLCSRRETVHDLLAALFTSSPTAAGVGGTSTGSGGAADGGGGGGKSSDGAALESATASRALDRLTGSRVPSMTDAATGVVRRATSKLSVRSDQSAPLSEAQLNNLLHFLFPDAAGVSNATQQQPQQYSERAQKLARDLKCAPLGSLAHRLTLAVATLNHTHSSGIHAVAHLWQEVVLELRYRWENSCPLPAAATASPSAETEDSQCQEDIVETPPDLGTSLLHQKLQMLQLCIGRKLAREKTSSMATVQQREESESVTASSEQQSNNDVNMEGDVSVDGEDGEDEFFECEEEPMQPDHQPDGRLRQFVVASTSSSASAAEPVRLLKRPDRVLWVPATQQAPPMTEDSLEEHTELLAKLGTDSQAAALRARMQSSSLLSDMQAFKAANPGCCLEDFVRWHSPRDFSNGQLSARMQLPGNIWLETWQLAKPIPARLQRRLFDDTKEVEKILQQLSGLTPAEVAKLLLPNAVLDGLASLVDLPAEEAAMLSESAPKFLRTLEAACEKACDATRERTANPDRYESLVNDIAYLELQVVRLRSLLFKFNSCCTGVAKDSSYSTDPVTRQFLLDLLRQPEVPVVGASRGPIGSALQRMFVESHAASAAVAAAAAAANSATSATLPESSSATNSGGKFPPFTAKEMLLRCVAPRPGPGSRPTPQRLYCVLARDDYRFAGAFTEDTTFL